MLYYSPRVAVPTSQRRSIMRSTATLLFCLLVVQPLTRAEIETEDHVLILTKENFDEAIKNHKYILVFYDMVNSPWCSEMCKLLTPGYAEAAVKLAEEKSKLRLGRIDCTKQKEIKECSEIEVYPYFRFFREGKPVEYDGGRRASQIIHWLEEKSTTPDEISTPEELTAFKEAGDIVVIGLFKNRASDAAKAFLKVASANKDVPFGISSEVAVYAAAGAEDGHVVLYRKFDEERSVLEKVGTIENLREFVAVHSLPLVSDITDESFVNIRLEWTSIEMSNMLFIDRQNADYEKISANFRESAKQFRGTVFFVTVHSDNPEYAETIDMLGLKKSDTPRIRMIRHFDLTKFKPADETNLEPAAISAFVQAVVNGEIQPYFLSQDVPEDWDKAPVKVLVGTNFDKVAFDKSKNVLVGFLAPGHPSSKELLPILEQLGEHFRHNDQVVISKYDFSANELEHTVTGYGTHGTLKLYKKNTNEVIEYKGGRTFEELKEFVETNSNYGEAIAEEA